MNLPDKIQKLTQDDFLPGNFGAAIIAGKFDEILDYLAERDRLPWDVSLLGRQTVTETGYAEHHPGAGGCCSKCEIFLDYKDDYQCSDDQCECHRGKTDQPPIDDWENEIRRRFYVYNQIRKSPDGAEKDLIEMIQRIKDENSSIHYSAGYKKGLEDGEKKVTAEMEEGLEKLIKGFAYTKKK